jgi:predicted Zn-dependent peptidase
LPSGSRDVIERVQRDDFVRFYRRWYQPQRLVVIAAGPVDGKTVERLIRARFGDLHPPGGRFHAGPGLRAARAAERGGPSRARTIGQPDDRAPAAELLAGSISSGLVVASLKPVIERIGKSIRLV